MSEHRDWVTRFAEGLQALAGREDRSSLARLRRGLGKPAGRAPERDAWVLRHLPEEVAANDRDLEACCLVASLFALHPEAAPGGSLGSAFRRLRELQQGDGPERRFVALLDSDAEDLPDHLRHAVSLLRAHGVAVPWAQLLRDLRYWNAERRTVQRAWSRDFWGGLDVPAAGANPTNP
jgi:CRISPR system Cascade subunit CasB